MRIVGISYGLREAKGLGDVALERRGVRLRPDRVILA